MRITQQWKVAGWITLLALGSGTIGAAVALRVHERRGAADGTRIATARLERLTEVLRLDPAQQERLRPVLERGEAEILALSATVAAEAARVGRRLDDEIRPLLDPDQRRRFERLVESRQRLRERWKAGDRLSPEQRERLRERLEQRPGGRPRGEPPRP
jgi:hypothetical protein